MAMRGLITLGVIFFFLLQLSFLKEARSAEAKKRNGVYIVYMGSAVSANGSLKNDHTLLLNSVLQRKKNALVHKYSHGFSGFAARLSAAEARSIAKKPGVVSVFPDPILQLHTTRSWDFLKYETGVVIDSNPISDDSGSSAKGSGAIIGILDTGIWPESDSFKDKDMDDIPPEWKGTCVKGRHFNSSNCNKKIIGARFYTSEDEEDDDGDLNTPRDFFGHGTHVASTAAGVAVPNASYYGLAEGTGKGGSPHSRIAVYRICEPRGCPGSNILAGFNDAIADGVDILSLSLGSRSAEDYKTDPIAIGAFHAVENGITVVCSAGNAGPNPSSVVNGAPWILTVGATTIDRNFESNVVLGAENKVIKGEAINFANIGESPVHPLIYAKSAKNSDVGDGSARSCKLDSLDEDKIKGKIVLCESIDDDVPGSFKKDEVQNKGGIGLILVNDMEMGDASNYLEFPMTVISSKDAADIFSYLNSTENPVATILATKTVPNFKPAPIVASFSSRGPSMLTKNILKPDVAAPGVNILAAWVANDTDNTLRGKEPPQFNVISGTSMSCPHVSGMAATIKSQNPEWGPSAIKSAIMTTASQMNNVKSPITLETGTIATPYDYGTGEMSTGGALQPGLVYETTIIDYLNFLCYYGYNTSTIALIANTVPKGFYCPEESSSDLISNINYPSIAVFFNLTGKQQTRNITRTVTNVASDGQTTYNVILDVPKGVNVDVIPDKLQFTKIGQRLSYQVIFSVPKSLLNRDVFGSITWANGKFRVRSPFVVGSK